MIFQVTQQESAGRSVLIKMVTVRLQVADTMEDIYERGGEPTIPSRKGAKFERHCDWWLYKERHLVEKYFLKLKGFRRIATRYDKLAATYLGFICIASILIWLK